MFAKLANIVFITASGAKYAFRSTDCKDVYALVRSGDPIPDYGNDLLVRLIGSGYLAPNNQWVLEFPGCLVKGYHAIFQVFGDEDMNTSSIEAIYNLN